MGFRGICLFVYALVLGSGLAGIEWIHDKRINALLGRTGEVAIAFSQRIDADEILEMYRDGYPYPGRLGSPHPYYQKYLEELASLKGLSPDWIPYIFVILPAEKDINDRCEDELPVVYLVDSLKILDPDNALEFKEVDCTSRYSRQAYLTREATFRPPYVDEWGGWMSVYVPLESQPDGTVVIFAVDTPFARLDAIRNQTSSEMAIYTVFWSVLSGVGTFFAWRWYQSMNRLASSLSILEQYRDVYPDSIDVDRRKVEAIVEDLQLSFSLEYLRQVGQSAREKRKKLSQNRR